MIFRTASSGTPARWAALALGCALVLGGCTGDGDGDAADEQAEPTATEGDAQDDQAAADDEQQDDQAAADDGAGDCAVDAATVTEILDIGVEVTVTSTTPTVNDGLSCIYEDEDLEIFVSTTASTWDGSDERVQQVLSFAEENYAEPVATPDLGDQAYLFDDDFLGTELLVFVDGSQYVASVSGSGDARLESLEEREAIVTELYQAAAG